VLTCLTESGELPEADPYGFAGTVSSLSFRIFTASWKCAGGGNLLSILEEQQKEQPQLLWIYRPKASTSENEGNLKLLQRFSDSSGKLSKRILLVRKNLAPQKKALHSPLRLLRPHTESNWQDYLYHYVRSCFRSLAGQSYRE